MGVSADVFVNLVVDVGVDGGLLLGFGSGSQDVSSSLLAICASLKLGGGDLVVGNGSGFRQIGWLKTLIQPFSCSLVIINAYP